MPVAVHYGAAAGKTGARPWLRAFWRAAPTQAQAAGQRSSSEQSSFPGFFRMLSTLTL
jgi:hypothetical protein